nr:hypothetical protein [Pandoravirus massiliensis]
MFLVVVGAAWLPSRGRCPTREVVVYFPTLCGGKDRATAWGPCPRTPTHHDTGSAADAALMAHNAPFCANHPFFFAREKRGHNAGRGQPQQCAARGSFRLDHVQKKSQQARPQVGKKAIDQYRRAVHRIKRSMLFSPSFLLVSCLVMVARKNGCAQQLACMRAGATALAVSCARTQGSTDRKNKSASGQRWAGEPHKDSAQKATSAARNNGRREARAQEKKAVRR